jgi:hypothetical protein
MRAAIPLPAFLIVLGALRTLFAVADGSQLSGWDTELDEVIFGLLRATIAERQVVLG